jgi:hypothetical protein
MLASGCVRDQGITSPIHQQHLAGMVFASAEIQRGAEVPATFKTSCVLGEPCYGRFYLQDSLRVVARQRHWADGYAQYLFALRASIDGRVVSEAPFAMDSWWSTYKFTLFRADSDAQVWEHPRWFLSAIARLPPGSYDLQFDVLPVQPGAKVGTGASIATGHVQLIVPPNSGIVLARAIARENQLWQAVRAQQEAWDQQVQAQQQSQAAPPAEQQPTCKADGTVVEGSHQCCSGHARSVTNVGFICCGAFSGPECRW